VTGFVVKLGVLVADEVVGAGFVGVLEGAEDVADGARVGAEGA
jgi:hypothetical protein